MILFLKLFLAHLIGDFVLQYDSMVEHKKKHKILSYQLYLHLLIHGVLTVILLWGHEDKWWISLLVILGHFVIDTAKIYLAKQGNETLMFFTDQALHILFLTGISYAFSESLMQLSEVNWNSVLLFSTAVVLLTETSSIIIRKLIAYWEPRKDNFAEENKVRSGDKNISLKNAGKYIGVLERLLIFGFVISGNFSAVGFLLGAKSIFRFGDLSSGSSLRKTEYILIGTLLSFGFALLISASYLYVFVMLKA